MRKILSQIFDGIAAGTLVTIGCCVFLGCYNDFRWVGAILFCVGLLAICYKGYSLYTGKIGFILEDPSKETFSVLFLGLLGNTIATIVVGIAVQYAIPNLSVTAKILCEARLAQEWWQTLLRATFCGILMYIAISIYRERKSPMGILFCIPVFILSGFEHSIADIAYFAIGGVYEAKALGFIWIVLLGNTIGSLLFPLMSLVGKSVKKEKAAEVVACETEGQCTAVQTESDSAQDEAACDNSENVEEKDEH